MEIEARDLPADYPVGTRGDYKPDDVMILVQVRVGRRLYSYKKYVTTDQWLSGDATAREAAITEAARTVVAGAAEEGK
ncbi:hypothetical protein PV336_16285 [Streptomyces sp. MI02-2A]|uniref:hypothetical protein n=1 Tax=Streptomyces sp. MI02-2A TaxID=3028688 RepID=UPI0029BDD593|nr:hypothetical protein [Streptomyces sp. MI02-2A]MDX3260780.1 hypothetical protein [Streptomyces sp. MI02-2A]